MNREAELYPAGDQPATTDPLGTCAQKYCEWRRAFCVKTTDHQQGTGMNAPDSGGVRRHCSALYCGPAPQFGGPEKVLWLLPSLHDLPVDYQGELALAAKG